MRLKKEQRAVIKQKFAGHCAYCGEVLGEKWHADHHLAIRRNDFFTKGAVPEHPERDCIENLFPSCVPCNIDKHSMTLEDWRNVISKTNQVLQRDSATFRRALRYGLVEARDVKVVFYFETFGK